ncbi:MAG: DUF5074 domain-containing protein [Bacteroidota bacterium]
MQSISKFLMLILAGSLLFLGSCKEEIIIIPEPGKYDNGILVSNEGPFQNGTGTVSFIHRDSGFVLNEIFQTENNRPLGNIVQSVSEHLGRVYIVVNNSNKIEVVNAADFESIGTIEGLNQPRYFLGIDGNKGYVSEWGDTGSNGAVHVVDLNTLTITQTFTIGGGPERMLRLGDRVYVANSGGFGSNNKIFIYDVNEDLQENVIDVGDNPNSMQLDQSGNLWVLCAGNKVYNADFSLNLDASTAGGLYRINTLADEVVESYVLSDKSVVPGNLVVNPDRTTLYYTGAGVHEQAVNAGALNETPMLNNFFYGLAVDPQTGNLYGCNARDFNSNGAVEVYAPDGTFVTSYDVGIIPGNVIFR